MLITGIIKTRLGGYKAIIDGVVLNIPEATGNRHYIAIQEAIAEGATVIQEPQPDQAPIIRTKRDILLSNSDWVVTKSYETNTPIPQEWLDYRQALRDVPQQSGFPDEVIWPSL